MIIWQHDANTYLSGNQLIFQYSKYNEAILFCTIVLSHYYRGELFADPGCWLSFYNQCKYDFLAIPWTVDGNQSSRISHVSVSGVIAKRTWSFHCLFRRDIRSNTSSMECYQRSFRHVNQVSIVLWIFFYFWNVSVRLQSKQIWIYCQHFRLIRGYTVVFFLDFYIINLPSIIVL